MRHSLFTRFCQAREWLWAPGAILVPIATCGSSEEKNTEKQTLFKTTTIRPPSWPGGCDFPARSPQVLSHPLPPRDPLQIPLEEVLRALKVTRSCAAS